MTLNETLERELEAHLTADEIERFEAGELCLFVRKPKLAFFLHTPEGYWRADVTRTSSPSAGADVRVCHDVYSATRGEVLSRVRNQDEVLALPVEVGFGEGPAPS